MAFIFISPLIGFVLGALLLLAISWIFVRATPSRVDRWFRRLQLVSASLYSLGHGGNDAQKTIGIIWMLLIAAGYTGADDPVPYWVVVACYVDHRPGHAVRRLAHRQDHGPAHHQDPAGRRLLRRDLRARSRCSSPPRLGIPVSTTHTITGSIVGVGAAQSVSAVRWGVAGDLLWAWILTIPCSAFIAGARLVARRGTLLLRG